MTKRLVVLLTLVVALTSSAALANPMYYWADATGVEIIAPVDAAPGDVVRVWLVARTNRAGWPGTYGLQSTMWWDVNVIANAGSGDGTLFPAQFYDDAGNGMISDVVDPPGGNYDATPVWHAPQFNYFISLDFWGSPMWVYGGMRINGWDIPVRVDAPQGLTTIGSAFNDIWRGWAIGRMDTPAEGALQINVIPEPATMSLLAIGGVAALIRRRRK